MLSDRDLGKALDDIFEFMESKGIFIDPDKKNEIKEKLTEDLHDTLTLEDVKDPNVQKKIMSCITALVMGKTKDYDNVMATLKSEDKDLKTQPDLKIDSKLTAELMLLAFLCKEVAKNDFKPDPFKQNLLKLEKEKSKTSDDEEKVSLIEKQTDECLRNIWGGDNPTKSGTTPRPVYREVGNLFGFIHQAPVDPKSPAEIIQEAVVDYKADPNGSEAATAIEALGMGITTALTDGIYLPSLLSPHPHMPGGK